MRHGKFGLCHGCFSISGGFVCVFALSFQLLFFFGLFLFFVFPPNYCGEAD
jgi:hypothetical protein